MIELRTLGWLDLRRPDGSEVTSVLAQPKRLALLVYLALGASGGFARRDTLLGMFWPDSTDERARGALRQSVRYLRSSLGAGTLVNRSEDELGIAEGVLRCDVADFRAALARGDGIAALTLYRGGLLDGFSVTGAPGFERWLETERDTLRSQATTAAWRIADEAAADGDVERARAFALRATEIAPLDENGVRRRIALLDTTGDRAGAVRLYEDFARQLAEELELEPAAATRALVEEIRKRGATGDPPPPRPAPRTPERPRPPAAPDPSGWPSHPRGSRPQDRGARLVLLGLFVALGLGGASFLALRGPEPPLNPRRVVVAPFENRTGDRALDPVSSMAADWIIQSLAGRGALEVVPITATLVSARYLAGDVPPAGTGYPSPATPPDAFSLARETGAGTAVSGSFYRQGDSIYFQARIDDVRTGSVLSGMEAIGSALDSPLEAIDRLRERVLVALVPLSDERDTHVRLAARPSYAAYQSYVRGFETFVHGDVRTALRHFQRAIAADSTFMMPAIASGIMHMNLADYAAADSAARRVDRNRDHLNPFEVATLDMLVGWLRGDDAHAYEASVRQARMAPGSIGEYQVAEQARRLNRPRETVAVLTAMGPERGELRGWFFYWRELTAAHHMLGDHRAELRAARRAREIYRATPAVLRQEVTALAALGDVNGVHSLIEERLSTRPAQAPTAGALMLLAARELAAHGHQPEAIPLFQRAIEWYRIQPSNETDAGGTGYGLGAALYHAHRWEEAQAVFIELAREAPRNLTFQGYLGVIAARLGNHEEAERIEAWLDDPAREYVFGNDALWRARILSLLGRHDQAMQQLRDAFARGVQHHPLHHLDIDLDPLREHPGFIELMRPKG